MDSPHLKEPVISADQINKEEIHEQALHHFNNEILTMYAQIKNNPPKKSMSESTLVQQAIFKLYEASIIDDIVKAEMLKMIENSTWFKNFIPLLKKSLNIEIDSQKYPELDKFLKRYYCPTNVKDLYQNIYERQDSILLGAYNDFTLFERVINAARMRNYIQSKHFKHLEIPEQCLTLRDSQWTLIAKNVGHYADSLELSLSEVKELTELIEDTGFADWGGYNILQNFKNKKLAFVDTENKSFAIGSGINLGNNLFHQSKLNYLLQAVPHLNRCINTKAQTWLQNRINTLAKSPTSFFPSLPNNPNYDDPDINFEQVKEELKQMLNM
jgi:hypothetical protein